jgi:hypothetical protein
MFKTKGAMFGLAAAFVASALILAGMAVTTSTGAATDLPGHIGAGPSGSLDAPGTDPGTGNPPAAPVEPPAAPPTTGIPSTGSPATTVDTPNTGNTGAGGSGPGSLPDAGFGSTAGSGLATMIVLFALAGAALAGAGATAVAANRKA